MSDCNTSRARVRLRPASEGCEWDTFFQMSREDPDALSGVAMILTEIHMVQTFGLKTEQDLRKFQEFFEFLLERQGFRFWYLHANKGSGIFEGNFQFHPRMLELGVRSNRCCYEIALVNPSLIHRLMPS